MQSGRTEGAAYGLCLESDIHTSAVKCSCAACDEMLLKCISMNVLCLCDMMALSLHINIAAAEGEIKRSFFLKFESYF